MSEKPSPALDVALFLDHILAGIERLEGLDLDEGQAVEATRLAWRLAKIGRR